MNAGCFDREMSDVVAGVKAADENGEKEFGHARCGFAYRKSVFQSNGMIVTRVLLALKPEKPEKIRAAMKEILEKKKLTQPLEYPSAGSIFRAEGGRARGTFNRQGGFKGAARGRSGNFSQACKLHCEQGRSNRKRHTRAYGRGGQRGQAQVRRCAEA